MAENEKICNGFVINDSIVKLNYDSLENKPDIETMVADSVAEVAPPIINEKMDPVIQETNEYIHDQRCIQFQENDNVAMVILDEMAKHPWPYSAKFQSKNGTLSRTLKQVPPLDEFTAKIISSNPTGYDSIGGFIINAFCIGGADNDTSSETDPNWQKYCYLELQTVARNVKDVNRFKWWARLAYGSKSRPSETHANMQIHWQKALDDGNFGFATMRRFEKTNENIVQRIFTDFSTQYKPYHAFYCSLSNDITSTLTKIPSDIVGSFQMHVWTSEGDAGTIDQIKWKGVYHFELIGHNAAEEPVFYIGYLNYTGTSKPGTNVDITWQKSGESGESTGVIEGQGISITTTEEGTVFAVSDDVMNIVNNKAGLSAGPGIDIYENAAGNICISATGGSAPTETYSLKAGPNIDIYEKSDGLYISATNGGSMPSDTLTFEAGQGIQLTESTDGNKLTIAVTGGELPADTYNLIAGNGVTIDTNTEDTGITIGLTNGGLPAFPTFDNTKRYKLVLIPNGNQYILTWVEDN